MMFSDFSSPISGGGWAKSLSSIRPTQCPPLKESVLGHFLLGFDRRPLLPPVYGWQKKEWRGTFHHIHRDIA